MELVADGQSKTYTIKIPSDQEPGIFWYHNHAHGVSPFHSIRYIGSKHSSPKLTLETLLDTQTSAYAYLSSLFGFIIVEGTDSDLDKAPGLEDATEVLMLFSESLVNDDKSVPPFFPIVYSFNWYSLVNGYLATETLFTFTQGETVLFRTVSGTVEPIIHFVIPGVTFWIVAYDGIPVVTPIQVSQVNIGGGQRIEFVARFDEPGTYNMTRLAWGDQFAPNEEACQAGFGGPYPCISYGIDKPVGTIVVEPAPQGTVLPTGSVMDSIQLPEYSDRYKQMENMPIAASKSFVFEQAFGYPIFQFPFDGNGAPPGRVGKDF